MFVENTSNDGDFCNVSASIPRLSYVTCSDPIAGNELLGSVYDAIQQDETAFYHYSDPACLAAYSAPAASSCVGVWTTGS